MDWQDCKALFATILGFVVFLCCMETTGCGICIEGCSGVHRGEAEVVRVGRLASRRVLPLIALEEQYNKKALVGQTKSSVTFFAGYFLKDFEIFSRKSSDS
jgi:hypothetical protein